MTVSSPNVAWHLSRQAAAEPQRPALHVPLGRVRSDRPSPHWAISFAELNADADALAHGLTSCGIGRGTRVVMMVPFGPDFFALTFALFKVSAVPVFMDPRMGLGNLGRCIHSAEPGAFIGVARAHLARRVFGWGRDTIRVTVCVGRRRWGCDVSTAELRDLGAGHGPYPVPDVAADEIAAVLFTSGSTGEPKGAEYTHGIFATQVELLRATYGIEPGEVDLCTFPLFALFGPALGMTCVLPDMDTTRPARADPRRLVAQIRQFGVTNLFGSPAVIRRLADLAIPMPTLRRAISAGAPASLPTVERFSRLLAPGVELFTPYGATEALPVANIGSREILQETRAGTEQGQGVCVGRPVPGVRVRVVRISDDPIPHWDESLVLPPGQVGEFVVAGPVVTRRYYNRPGATALAKILDPVTGEVWHRMGDVGYLDEHGRLWFCGRKSHRVETPDGTLFTDRIEPVLNAAFAVLGPKRTALVGVRREGVTYPVVCVEEVAGPWPSPDVYRELARRHEATRSLTTFLSHPGPFPVDPRHNSKIIRERLAAWADRRLGRRWRPEAPS